MLRPLRGSMLNWRLRIRIRKPIVSRPSRGTTDEPVGRRATDLRLPTAPPEPAKRATPVTPRETLAPGPLARRDTDPRLPLAPAAEAPPPPVVEPPPTPADASPPAPETAPGGTDLRPPTAPPGLSPVADSTPLPEAPAEAAREIAPAAYCPNCRSPLEEKPRQRVRCPHCSENIHVRWRQRIFRSGLVAERDVNAVDFLENLEPFGITEALCRERLEAAQGLTATPPALAEILWTLGQERLPGLPEAAQVRLLNEMSMFLHWQGKDCVSLRRKAEGIVLRRLLRDGTRQVRISPRGAGACPACHQAAGTVLETEREIDAPSLPLAACIHPDGLCRCSYSPVRGG